MSLISSSRWKGQVAGNSKKYWPSCPACRARVLQIRPLFNPNSPTNPMLTEWAVSSSGLLWRTVIHLLESCPSPWRPFCLEKLESALKLVVQHKKRSRQTCTGYFFTVLTPVLTTNVTNFKLKMKRSSCREFEEILTQLYVFYRFALCSIRTVPLTQCSLNELFLHPAFCDVLSFICWNHAHRHGARFVLPWLVQKMQLIIPNEDFLDPWFGA